MVKTSYSPTARCQKCGKPVKDPKFKFCFECNQKAREGGGDLPHDLSLPPECVFQSFYDSNKSLKRAVFIEAPEKVAQIFMNANISQTSVRNLFNLLKDTEKRIKTDKKLDFGVAQDGFYRFHRLVVYNVGRMVDRRPLLHPIFKEFVDKHLDVATKSREEFLGFVEYLTGIVARLKTKY